jgi:hypothetical protein
LDTHAIGPRDQAAVDVGDYLIGFNVWWKNKPTSSMGFMSVQSMLWFHQFIQQPLSIEMRCFYQIIDPKKTCGFYFDIDIDDPNYNIPYFLQALFEEMSRELKEGWNKPEVTPQYLWKSILLLDASNNTKGSCHGICQSELMFKNNHQHMKMFAQNVLKRLEQRDDAGKLRVKSNGKIPFDTKVYTPYRCFRMLGNVKMTPVLLKRRPLVLAEYNECKVVEPFFLQTLVPQGGNLSTILCPKQIYSTVSNNNNGLKISKKFIQMLPMNAFYSFLTLGGKYSLPRREIGFEWSNGAYMRNYTFENAIEFKKYTSNHGFSSSDSSQFKAPISFIDQNEMERVLIEKRPQTMHIGPVYMDGYKSRKWEKIRNNYIHCEAPFVVDVDIDIKQREKCKPLGCKCGNQKKTCDACFKTILRPQLIILHYLLGPNVLDKKGLLADFSGNKGFHLWVLDKNVWGLTDLQRSNLKSFLERKPMVGEPLFDLIQKDTGK